MENQHRKIKGYRELTQEEIDLMNRIKSFGPELQSLINDILEYLHQQHDGPSEAVERLEAAEPYEWVELGKTDLQVGLMKLTRSIAQPEFF